MPQVTLVLLPFASFRYPSLAIGTLTACCQRYGIEVEDYYPMLDYAAELGLKEYDYISNGSPPHFLLGEWCFSELAFNKNDRSYLNEILESNYGKQLAIKNPQAIDQVHNIFHKAVSLSKNFIKRTARKLVNSGSKIVGSSVSYQQITPTIALFKELKRLDPSIITIAGGASCEDVMGKVLCQNVPEIDFVVSGEADDTFPQLCQALINGKEHKEIDLPGVFTIKHLDQQDAQPKWKDVVRKEDLNELPDPMFDGYFHALKRLYDNLPFQPSLMIETSRGCWKGQKQPCYFCGLTGRRINYRRKSASNVLAQADRLASHWGLSRFLTSDTILDLRLRHGFFDILEKRKAPYQLFFETSSLLQEKQIKQLAGAGVIWIQPGIENLNDDLLDLLNKGNSTIQNVALLKYSLENGVYASWNMLHGIPGEQGSHYRQLGDDISLLFHLQPPNGMTQIRFDRFSRYFEHSDNFRLDLKPMRAYQKVFSHWQNDLNDMAYFFRNESPVVEKELETELKRVEKLVNKWRESVLNNENQNQPTLAWRQVDTEIYIVDQRPCAVSTHHCLSGLTAELHNLCLKPMTARDIDTEFALKRGKGLLSDWRRAMHELLDAKLVLSHGKHYLSLAVKDDSPSLHKTIEKVMNSRRILHQVPQKCSRDEMTWQWLKSL